MLCGAVNDGYIETKSESYIPAAKQSRSSLLLQYNKSRKGVRWFVFGVWGIKETQIECLRTIGWHHIVTSLKYLATESNKYQNKDYLDKIKVGPKYDGLIMTDYVGLK